VINKEQGPLKTTQGSDPDALNKLAETLDGVASKVESVELKDDKLIGFRNDYASMAKDLAKSSRETAKALQSNDPKQAAEAAKTMSSFGPRESQLVDSINKYCSGG
jgi:predicted transcriptional regulator